MSAQFHWNPETYLDEIRAEVPRYDELQEATVEAIPFPPGRVLELGVGTGETTRRLLERYPDAEVTGLDAQPEMVFQAARARDRGAAGADGGPAPRRPLGPGRISVLSVHHLDDDAEARPVPARARAVAGARDRRRGHGRAAGDAARAGRRPSLDAPRTWRSGAAARSSGGRTTWRSSAPSTTDRSGTGVRAASTSFCRPQGRHGDLRSTKALRDRLARTRHRRKSPPERALSRLRVQHSPLGRSIRSARPRPKRRSHVEGALREARPDRLRDDQPARGPQRDRPRRPSPDDRGLGGLPRRRLGRRRDPHRGGRGVLRRRRPQDLHPADHRRRERRATSARSSSSA